MSNEAQPFGATSDPQSSQEGALVRKKGFTQSSCVYTSCYCEENVWKLCERIRKEAPAELKQYYAVFISNDDRQVPMWMQKHAKDPLTPVVWDYHVILICRSENGALVYDLDAVLPFPCPLEDYVQQAIRSERTLKKNYHRKFRVIKAGRFLETFASDRTHMRKANGEYTSPPPPYPPIRTADEEMNLDDFIDMTSELGHGHVKDLRGLLKMFGVNIAL